MRYLFEIDETTNEATLTIGDGQPVRVGNRTLEISRDPVVDEEKSAGGPQHLVPGPKGKFTLIADLDYGPVNKFKK